MQNRANSDYPYFSKIFPLKKSNFRLGCHRSIAIHVAPVLMKNLEQQAPEINVQFIDEFSRKITEKIVSYEIDLAYVVNSIKHPDLVFKKLGDNPIAFWKKKSANRNLYFISFLSRDVDPQRFSGYHPFSRDEKN